MQKDKDQKTKPNMKTRFYSFVLLIGVVLIGWALYQDKNFQLNIFWNKLKSGDAPLVDQSGNVNKPSIVTGNYLEGRLENSDDIQRGNLKLVSGLGQIYIRTSRDFSALIGFNVLMTVDGTLDQFTLLNIEKRVEKDGYIQAQ